MNTFSLWLLVLAPVVAAVVGAALSSLARPSGQVVSGIRHFAAGVVFAAAAGEILPDMVHGGSPVFATVIGGAAGVAMMLLVKKAEDWIKDPRLIAAIGIDLLVDGLELGVALHAVGTDGLLLGIALTIEVLSLGLAITSTLAERWQSRFKLIAPQAGFRSCSRWGRFSQRP